MGEPDLQILHSCFQKWKLLPDGRDLVKINGSDLHSLVLIHLI